MNDIKDELLIQELEESVKQDRINQIWKDYGSYVIAGAALIVLMTAFASFRGNYEMKTNAHNTGMVMKALEEKESAKVLTETAEALKPGQRAVALLTAAGLALQDKKYEDALARYRTVSEDKSLPALYRDMAALMSVRTEWGFGKEKKDPAVYLGYLGTIIQDDKNPWRFHARMQAAMITAHDKEDYLAARKYLIPLLGNDPSVPPSLSERAKSLDHIYSMKQKEAGSSTGGEASKG